MSIMTQSHCNNPNMTMLTVIIVNYNGALFIKKCLDSVMHQLAHMPHMKIIVIDNASTDASLDCIAPYESNITLIKNTVNVGFPAAHNQILDQLSSPYLWLLNNDTEFSLQLIWSHPLLTISRQIHRLLDYLPNCKIRWVTSSARQWVFPMGV